MPPLSIFFYQSLPFTHGSLHLLLTAKPRCLRALCCLLYCTELAEFHCDLLFQSKSIFLILLLNSLATFISIPQVCVFVCVCVRYCYHSNPQFPDIAVDNMSCDARLHRFRIEFCGLNAKFPPRARTRCINVRPHTLK